MHRAVPFAALLLAATAAWANPIPWPPPASMPLEDMHVRIIDNGDLLYAEFDGEFTFTYIPATVTSMLFPVPPLSAGIAVWQDGVRLWNVGYSSQTYPTVLPEIPTIPMITWNGPFPEQGCKFRVRYMHPLIERPGEYIFFYANGTGKYFPTYEKNTTAYFDIEYPLDHVVTGVQWDTLPYTYQVEDYRLTLTVQSYYGPIVHDVIVSLVPNRDGGDCNSNRVPDGFDRVNRYQFASAPSPLGENPGTLVAMADLNGDGRADAIIGRSPSTLQVRMNFGGGVFSPPTDYTVTWDRSRFEVADFNGDAAVDLIGVNTSGTVTLLLNSGDGTFLPARTQPTCSGCTLTAVNDVDGDLLPDLILVSSIGSSTNKGYVFRNLGDGTFSQHATLSLPMYVQQMICQDFTGDHVADLVVTSMDSSASLAIYPNDRTGSFPTRRVVLTNRRPVAMTAARLDFPADLDLVVADENNTVSILENWGGATFVEEARYGVRPRAHSIQTMDMDADGKLDLLVGGEDYLPPGQMFGEDGAVTVLLNRGGASRFEPGRDLVDLPGPAGGLRVVDVLGDSRPELLIGTAVYENQLVSARLPDIDLDGVLDACDHCTNTPSGWTIDATTGCLLEPFPDLDFDGDVDLDDADLFYGCANGPAHGPATTDCGEADFDRDGDVDQADFAVLQRCFSGADVMLDPTCVQ